MCHGESLFCQQTKGAFFNYIRFVSQTDDYTIASYTYGSQNGKLLKTTYGNGFYVENVYDNLDRISEIKYNGEVKFRFEYNSEGRLSRHEDLVNGHVTKYTYDGYGRLINSSLMNSSEDAVQFRAENLYDSYGRVDTVNYYSGQNILSYNITYKGNTSLVESVSLPSGASIDYTYDKFNCLTEEDNGPLNASYTYLSNSANSSTSARFFVFFR